MEEIKKDIKKLNKNIQLTLDRMFEPTSFISKDDFKLKVTEILNKLEQEEKKLDDIRRTLPDYIHNRDTIFPSGCVDDKNEYRLGTNDLISGLDLKKTFNIAYTVSFQLARTSTLGNTSLSLVVTANVKQVNHVETFNLSLSNDTVAFVLAIDTVYKWLEYKYKEYGVS